MMLDGVAWDAVVLHGLWVVAIPPCGTVRTTLSDDCPGCLPTVSLRGSFTEFSLDGRSGTLISSRGKNEQGVWMPWGSPSGT